MSLVLIAASIFSVAADWQRRVYYTDNTCKGTFQFGEQVYIPSAPCPNPSKDYGAICESKSTDALVKSSEGTSCEKGTGDDSVFMTSAAPNTSYLSLNAYNGASCDAKNVQITQRTYAADGKCYVFEPGYYFKASCTETSGTITFCKDNACTDCSAPATTSSTCGQGLQIDGQPTRMICSTPQQLANRPPNSPGSPTSSTQPSSTTKSNDAIKEVVGLAAGVIALLV